MAQTLRHRGPDAIGAHHDRWATLGHTRLSIIDIEGGAQPLANEDGSIWVVFNGEIYNHAELREPLIARGHRLATRCDTEVIVHLYEEYGEDFVHRLNGMFAIALWDVRNRTLLLVRDRLGVKPLYWYDDGQRIAFGSELKALLALGDIPQRVDPCAIADYLTFGHVPAPRTIFEGVRKLEPGHLAICREDQVTCRRYWDIPPASSAFTPQRNKQAVEQFAALLDDAVRIRMIADVPLGAFLSGGLDSAAIVAGMTRQAGGGAVLTHTAGFNEHRFDERALARATAARLGTDHRELLVCMDAAGAATQLAWHFDEPFADSSAVPTYYLSQAARQRVTVALAGDGADELLGGYRRYRFTLGEEQWRARLPRTLCAAAGVAGSLYPKADWLPRPLRARATLQNLARDPIAAHLHSTSLVGGTLPALLMHGDVQHALGHYDPYQARTQLARRYPSDDLLGRLLYLDTKTLLADDMLTKVDRTSMAVGLEVREPLLDYRLVELAARLPSALRTNKAVLRGTLCQWSHVPLADRRKKGFDIPIDAWFRGSLRDLSQDAMCSRDARIGQWIEPSAVRRLLAHHQRGWRNNGATLWALLSLELWARTIGTPAASRRIRETTGPLHDGAAA